jgi:nucleoside-diphosphate-sugar epimerase
VRQGNGHLNWLPADMADMATARRVVTQIKPAYVFHLAGSVGASPAVREVLPTFHSLLTSTVNLLLAAMEIGCRRIILSGSLTEPRPNASPPAPSSPYAAAKWAGGAYGRMFHALYGAPVLIVRPFMAYGPGQDPRKLVPYVTSSLLKGEAPRLSSGRTKGDWVYLSDVIEAFLLAAAVPDIEGMTIDIGTGTLVSTRQIVEGLVEAVGGQQNPIFGALPDRTAENEFAADTTLAATKLGWAATTSLEMGLRQTVAWYRANTS